MFQLVDFLQVLPHFRVRLGAFSFVVLELGLTSFECLRKLLLHNSHLVDEYLFVPESFFQNDIFLLQTSDLDVL